MSRKLTVISSDRPNEQREILLPEGNFKHFRNILGVVLQDAQDTWADLWAELEGEVTHGGMILPSGERGLQPRCGWPEFLEKMWLLKHYLDYAKRFADNPPQP